MPVTGRRQAQELEVDEAVNRVLAVEQEALAVIRDAEAAAAKRVARARARARRVVERAGERISRLETVCQDAVTRRVAGLRQEEESLRDYPAHEDPRRDRTDAAIERLADALVGGPR
jgi:hypothetical protein